MEGNSMTTGELLDHMTSIEGVIPMLKSLNGDLVLIFWHGHSPIASVKTKEFEYRTDYAKLYELPFEQISKIDDWLQEYTQTPLHEREL